MAQYWLQTLAQFVWLINNLFDLRMLDVALSDVAMVCIDALRWSRADLYKLLPDGERRIAAVITSWGLDKSQDSAEA